MKRLFQKSDNPDRNIWKQIISFHKLYEFPNAWRGCEKLKNNTMAKLAGARELTHDESGKRFAIKRAPAEVRSASWKTFSEFGDLAQPDETLRFQLFLFPPSFLFFYLFRFSAALPVFLISRLSEFKSLHLLGSISLLCFRRTQLEFLRFRHESVSSVKFWGLKLLAVHRIARLGWNWNSWNVLLIKCNKL